MADTVDDPMVLAQGLRSLPKDATAGSVDFAPPTLLEKIQGSGPRSALASAAAIPAELGMGVPMLGRYLADQRVNAMFSPAQKAFWKLFGRRAVD